MHRFYDHVEVYDIQRDIGETNDVAAKHPEVVALLKGKMNIWVESLGAALTHLPPPTNLDSKPAPEGEVLEVTVTVTDKAKPKDTLVVPFAGFQGRVFATDYLEYDLAMAPGGPRQGFYYSPFKGNDIKTVSLNFKRGEGIDQFGREQASGPEIQGGSGVWEHRIIGLCGSAPGILPRHGIVFKGGKPGTYKVYIDNLRIRHADGTTTPIWLDGNETRTQKIADTEQFKGVQVRAVLCPNFDSKPQ